MMKLAIVLVSILLSFSCSQQENTGAAVDQQELNNESLRSYQFLAGMYFDDYFPDFLVDKGRQILLQLCAQIEKETPTELSELYVLTHEATERFNDLDNEFNAYGSELETVAREVIAMDMDFIAKAYGFEPDIEELIAPRDW